MVRAVRTGRRGRSDTDASAGEPSAIPPSSPGAGAPRAEGTKPVLASVGGSPRAHPRRWRRLLRRWADHLGVVIALAALSAFVLGIIGFRQFIPGRRFTDYVYRSLELFVIYVEHHGVHPDNRSMPVTLEFARFLAPAAAAAASIRAVLGLLGERTARAWVRYFVRDHVVVCGLGPVGVRLAISFQEAGQRVVALTPDGSDTAAHECRAHGVIVLVGDPTDRQLLRQAGVASARYLVVASADDETNADVALAAREVVAHRRRALQCFVHVVHPGLSNLLVEAVLGAGTAGSLRLEFFNVWESVPPMVLDEHPPGGSGEGTDGVPHMLVVGPGQLGRPLVVYAARRWATDPNARGRRLQVTLVGPGAEEAGADLSRRYSRLPEVCDLRVHEVEIDSAAFERAAFADGQGVTSAYVTDDDATGLRAALMLARVLPDVGIVVLTRQHAGLASLVSEVRPEDSPIALFDVLDRSCRPDILLKGTIELLARAIHRAYVRAQEAAGRTPEENPSMRDWEELPESTKEANRAQAADVGRKLAAVDCGLRPWTDWTGEVLAFAPDEVERMAEMEHERWCREREAEGWTYGQAKDDARRTTPYLVPWDQLTDEVKEYDRVAVRNLPELLMSAGFEVVRRPGGGLER